MSNPLYLLNGRATIHIGDVIARLRDLPDGFFDCVVTSPPYWGVRDYEVIGQMGMERTLAEHIEVMVAVFEEIRRVLKPAGTVWLNYGDSFAGTPNGRSAAATRALGNDDRTFRDKPFSTVGTGPLGADFMDRPFRDVVNAIKAKDLCMVPNILALALRAAGWWVRQENVWGKSNPMPDSAGKYRPSTAHEKIWMLAKSKQYLYDHAAVAMPASGTAHARTALVPAKDTRPGVTPKSAPEKSLVRAKESFHASTTKIPDTRYLRNFEPAPISAWQFNSVGFTEAHFATFPPELAERCINAGCPANGLVLDPFGGSGTTALVALRMGRRAHLIELKPEYADMARKRLERDWMGEDERRRAIAKDKGTPPPGPLFETPLEAAE
ncbi:methyltransferase [Devosia yakushimensis]|uniref:Methyltransferase n=1 Tax=Devosia yakushimensis TaxID=470028 RepID=A0ABQ5UDC0_9HYPH|nr:site-specific DNA-methyltransferase [Devosia yakushimensis]GLQ09213.1 methyltransferase [Devosia yakushimensis]